MTMPSSIPSDFMFKQEPFNGAPNANSILASQSDEVVGFFTIILFFFQMSYILSNK
jgi:hypothetical protein